MIPFKTTAEQVVQLAAIVTEMSKAGLPAPFVASVLEIGRIDQGVFDLAALWMQAPNAAERDECIAELQEAVDEAEEATPGGVPEVRPRVGFDALEGRVLPSVREHKKRLRELIDRHGGVSAVAAKAGIPQPSLSRMLNSGSMPRRTTLYKIASALDVEEAEVVGEWTR